MSTLTTANSSLYLTIVGVFNTPVKIQGYATDDAFAISELTNAETFIGVDGKLSAGFTPFIVPLSISLQADSASNAVFDAWIAAESATKDKYEAHIVAFRQCLRLKKYYSQENIILNFSQFQ